MERGFGGETMSERKHWKAEEKLSLINEIKDKGHVVETCRKYGADPTMFYRWKESVILSVIVEVFLPLLICKDGGE